jgi:hypothetical protein
VSRCGEGVGVISSLTGLRTEGMVMSLEEAVAGLWPSDAAIRSMKEGFAGGIGSGIVRMRCAKTS